MEDRDAASAWLLWYIIPSWMANLLRLTHALGTLEGRSRLDTVTCRKQLTLRVQGEDRQVSAYLADGELMVAGEPVAFGAEAAGQLVEHFQLGQRGNTIPWLTGAISNLTDNDRFHKDLSVLANDLGVPLPEPPATSTETVASGTPAAGVGSETTTRESVAIRPRNKAGDDRSDEDESAAEQEADDASKSGSRRAADQIGILVGRGRSNERAAQRTPSKPVKPRDDKKARRAVVEYEKRHGRPAKPMADSQPGFDVLSRDSKTGHQRHIEVKGVKGDYIEDASVLLTARQFEDALKHDSENLDYWLYVVDRTETDNPRVFPIPWTRRPRQLRYGFRADMWVQYAEDSDTTEEETDRLRDSDVQQGAKE